MDSLDNRILGIRISAETFPIIVVISLANANSGDADILFLIETARILPNLNMLATHLIVTARSELRKVLFLALPLFCFCMKYLRNR